MFELIRLIPTDQPNDHSLPDKPFRIQDRIPGAVMNSSSCHLWDDGDDDVDGDDDDDDDDDYDDDKDQYI